MVASSEDVADPKAEVILEPELELMEALEFDPPRDEPEVEAPLLLIEVLEGAAAIGADTLTVWVGTGRAMVTG